VRFCIAMAPQAIGKNSRIVIAGAGIGGLATALALQRRGFHPVVCERAPELREIGAGLLLSPNGVRALEFLGLKEAATSLSHVIREWRILDRRGRCLQRMKPCHGDLPALSLHRADLQQLLLAMLPRDCLRLGAEVSRFQPGATCVEVLLTSGETIKADALIGADGLRSSVRALRFGPRPPTYSGYVGWRGVSPRTPEAYTGDHLSESWAEGKRFGISSMGNGRCYWYATVNRPVDGNSASESRHAELLRLFGHWHAPIASLMEATPAENILRNEIYDRSPQHPWSDGRVTLLGDAAHPMTPNLGQGACFALEDACVIARCIEEAGNFPDAFRRYERLRRSRADLVQRCSRWMGKLIQIENPAATALRDLMLSATPNKTADFSMRRLFSFTP
jgi:2-polyprenyl-6-methoxyphenol hydroxylase-like FAD-dependent oxidoreductase